MNKHGAIHSALSGLDFHLEVAVGSEGVSLIDSNLAEARSKPIRIRGAVRTRGQAAERKRPDAREGLQLEGEIHGARVVVSIRRDSGGVFVRATAKRGRDRLRVELWSESYGFLGSDGAELLSPIKQALILLFENDNTTQPQGIGRVSIDGELAGDDGSDWELVTDDLSKLEILAESWSAYQEFWKRRQLSEDEKNNTSDSQLVWWEPIKGLVCGKDSPMEGIAESLNILAPTDLPLLILGESGTGKDLIAQVAHKRSPRKSKTFFPLNCGALSEREAASSALFGHVKGAFTGATSDREGAFQSADGGTLFLNEIAELPVQTQPLLLDALENSWIRRLGSPAKSKVDVRVIAATNKDPRAAILRGEFRSDLYHRLKVLEIQIPPLRARAQDIPSLIAYLAQYRVRFAKKLYEALIWYSWPGNVRDLKAFVDQTAALVSKRDKKELDLEDLEIEVSTRKLSGRLREAHVQYLDAAKRLPLEKRDQAIVDGIVRTATKMFEKVWEELSQPDASNEQNKLKPGDTQEIGKENVRIPSAAIQASRKEVKELLIREGFHPDNFPKDYPDCKILLEACYKEKKATLATEVLWRVYRSLHQDKVRLSNEQEKERHQTFLDFFGWKYDAARYEDRKRKQEGGPAPAGNRQA